MSAPRGAGFGSRGAALGAGTFAAEVRRAVQATRRVLRDVGTADSDEVIAAARVLVRTMRRAVGQASADGAPSAPGEAPRRQTGRLRRSIRHAVVDGVRRVGTGYFVGRILNDGADTERPPRPDARGRLRSRRGERRYQLAPRPWLEPALEAAQEEMTEVFVGAVQRRMR